jgi:hypothetical protein
MPNLGYTLKKRTKFAKGDRTFNEKGVFTSELLKRSYKKNTRGCVLDIKKILIGNQSLEINKS